MKRILLKLSGEALAGENGVGINQAKVLEIAKEKQVILAFTPTEYDANVQSILAKHYNSFHSLNLVDNKTVINSKQQ